MQMNMQLRLLLSTLNILKIERKGDIAMYYVDSILNKEIFNQILKDLDDDNYESLGQLVDAFESCCEQEYSDVFVHWLHDLCCVLIDKGKYDWVVRIIKLSPIVGTFENPDYEDEVCVISYAIKHVDDEVALEKIVGSCKGGLFTPYFYNKATPSIIAIDEKKYFILKTLFENMLCNEETCYGRWTALQHAAYTGNYKLAEYLLKELGHNPDLYRAIDIPPIGLAADANNFDMVELLLKYGANPSATDGNGDTAITYCRSDKMLDIFKKHGAVRLNVQQRILSRAIAQIKTKGQINPDTVKAIIGYKSPSFENQEANIIVLAARYGDKTALEAFMPFLSCADVDEIIFAMFDWCELDDKSYIKGIFELVGLTDVLVKAGAKKTRDIPIISPFHRLALRPELFEGVSDQNAFRLFDNIEKLGYSLTDIDCLGMNIFHNALENLNMSLVRYCLHKGMTYKELDTEDVSAIALLLGECMNQEFKDKRRGLVEGLLYDLLDSGCNINHQDVVGYTPLHTLATQRNFRSWAIKMLIRYGADREIKTYAGKTAYEIALKTGLSRRKLALFKPAGNNE